MHAKSRQNGGRASSGRLWVILEASECRSGRSGDALGRSRDAPGTLIGRSGAFPRGSRDHPGASRDASGLVGTLHKRPQKQFDAHTKCRMDLRTIFKRF